MNIYDSEHLKNNYVIEEGYRDDQCADAKKRRDRRARDLRQQGYTVKVDSHDYTDLGRFRLYSLYGTKPVDELTRHEEPTIQLKQYIKNIKDITI